MRIGLIWFTALILTSTTTKGQDNFSLITKADMPSILSETSGLLLWNGKLITHNDSGGLAALYLLDTINFDIDQIIDITNTINTDWEDLTQDEAFLYIGDFGNNLGTRIDLKILKINKADILNGNQIIPEIINFSFANQTDFSPNEDTNFDLEAMVAIDEYIYLFTKEWGSGRTTVYRLPKTEGTHVVEPREEWNTQGLITAATYWPPTKKLTLLGYTNLLSPFIVTSTIEQDGELFNERTERSTLSISTTQMEGIAVIDDSRFFLSCENFQRPPITNSPSRIFCLTFSNNEEEETEEEPIEPPSEPSNPREEIVLYGAPSSEWVGLLFPENTEFQFLEIFNFYGQCVYKTTSLEADNSLLTSGLSAGVYVMKIKTNQDERMIKFMRL